MNDAWLIAVAAVLMVLTPVDWYIAYRLSALATQKPHIPSLTGAALRSVAIAIAGTVFAILGAASIYFVKTGERLLQPPIPTLLIVVGAIVISLPNLYFLSLLRKFAADAEELRRHKRIGDPATRFHRRKDDVPGDEG